MFSSFLVANNSIPYSAVWKLVFFFFFAPVSNSWTPTGYLSTVQLNSDNVYLEIATPLQSQVHVVIYASGQSAIDQKFQLPTPWVWLICFSHSHKTQRHILFTRLPVDDKRYRSGTASCKRGLDQVMVKRVWSLHVFLGYHSPQDMETTCWKMNGWKKCVYIYSRILFPIKEEILIFVTTWMKLSEISQAENDNTVWYYSWWNLKKPNWEAESRMALPGTGEIGKWKEIGQRAQISGYRWVHLYSMVTIVSNTVLYIWKLLTLLIFFISNCIYLSLAVL